MVPRVQGIWFRAWGTGYMVSKVRVSDFESMGTQFQWYWVTGYGYV